MTYRIAAETTADAEVDSRVTYDGAPQVCPFCHGDRWERGRFTFTQRVVGKWDKASGRVAERCRNCDGRWWVRPKDNQVTPAASVPSLFSAE